jgi:hypothetical protein
MLLVIAPFNTRSFSASLGLRPKESMAGRKSSANSMQ